MQGITQRTPETLERNLHHIPILKSDAIAKTQAVGPEEMHVYVSRSAMTLELEVMMFQVPQAVAHLRLAGSEPARPEHTTVPVNLYFCRHRGKLGVHDQFRTERARPEFRARQVEIVLLLEPMIGELVARGHPDAVRRSVWPNHIDAGYLRLLATVFSITRDIERLPVCPQRGACPFVKPFWRNSDLSRRGTPSLLAPIKHLHTVRHLVARDRVHGLAVPGTAQMSKAGPGDHATRGLVGMVDWRQHLPFRPPAVHHVILQPFRREPLLRQIAERRARLHGRQCKFVNRIAAVEHTKVWFFDQRHASHGAFLDLNQPHHSITSKSCSFSSSIVRPRPGTLSSRSMKPSFDFGSPSNRYQKSSFPTSTSTMGKYSAIGELRLAMTT